MNSSNVPIKLIALTQDVTSSNDHNDLPITGCQGDEIINTNGQEPNVEND